MSTGRTIKANGPVRIDRIAEKLLDPVVSKAGFSSTQILAAWTEIVGPGLAERSRPERLRWPQRRENPGRDGAESGGGEVREGATLVVRAEGGDALELQYASAEVVARINAIFGWRAVERLTIRQAPVETGQNRPPTQRSPADPAKSAADEAAGRLETVEDEQLRAALARLGSRIGTDTKP